MILTRHHRRAAAERLALDIATRRAEQPHLTSVVCTCGYPADAHSPVGCSAYRTGPCGMPRYLVHANHTQETR